MSRGEIYDYVGDEIIVTWMPDTGLHQSRCVRCFIDICKAIDSRSNAYKLSFGHIPKIRAALHIGQLWQAKWAS